MNLPLQLDRGDATPLRDQLFEQLRRLIVGGMLKPNARVIATRFLAEQVGVSRTTVLLAYERLISEGYLETRPAIGTFVSARLPQEPRPDSARALVPDIPRQASLYPAMVNGFVALQEPTARKRDRFHAVALGRQQPLDLQGLAEGHAQRARAGARGVCRSAACRRPPRAAARGGGSLGGDARHHGLAGTGDRRGRPRQACSFVAHLFQRPNGPVVLESPGDPEIAAFFKARHAELVPVAVDEHGLETEKLPHGPVSLAYVTPARQNPLGGILPLPRREALIAWAREAAPI